jgi:release factor glutamine methyltransferase
VSGDGEYRPMMPDQRVQLLRRWHEAALAGGIREREITVTAHGCTFVVPPDVYPPNPLGLAEIVREEVREQDRVLDMGTGSGVNGIVAAAAAREVVAVDVSPAAVECARRNAERNGVATRFQAVVGDLFDQVGGSFDLILFDPPFRWFAPRSMVERGMADENYRTLTAFFEQAAGFLTPGGRILLSFGTTGDIDYLHHLIERGRYDLRELRRVEGEKDGVPVAYVAYRLTPSAVT